MTPTGPTQPTGAPQCPKCGGTTFTATRMRVPNITVRIIHCADCNTAIGAVDATANDDLERKIDKISR